MRALRRAGAALLAGMLLLSGTALAENRFSSLCAEAAVDAKQSDIVAWIEIPEASFCEPVAQHPKDDSFYSTHDIDGDALNGGILYTQKTYNSSDFTDPVTVVYGSSAHDGTPLRHLQETYSGRFAECRRVLLHLPEGTQEFEVFAAVPYSSLHILHYYDFASARRYNTFFDAVYDIRALGMHVAEGESPEFGDRVLILSTGMRGDRSQRYLVLAKQAASEHE